jgi:hypothetical protein
MNKDVLNPKLAISARYGMIGAKQHHGEQRVQPLGRQCNDMDCLGT